MRRRVLLAACAAGLGLWAVGLGALFHNVQAQQAGALVVAAAVVIYFLAPPSGR